MKGPWRVIYEVEVLDGPDKGVTFDCEVSVIAGLSYSEAIERPVTWLQQEGLRVVSLRSVRMKLRGVVA